ncbi:tRNA splicing endonuclease subunit sen2 [Marasmius crinis-equi]|uniref:tRNA-splicing endonuclease subunit Sen2 n=1 Tax=Marasmius crinis-equi TaxID=585013 RepID=A0ABR3FYY6_9AGAR
MAGGRHRNTGGPNKGGARRAENNRIYAHPLPISFHSPFPAKVRSVLGLLGLSLSEVVNPHCEGYLDIATRSVWVTDPSSSRTLWRKGFFGKGDLSRSEPSWLARQINDRKTGRSGLTSEQIREKRRAERKQFKIDRAQAIAAVAAEAEAVFETEGRVIVPALSGPEIPSGATWKPSPSLEASQPVYPTPPDEEEEFIENLEHLQLTLCEAFFLAWNLDCIVIIDPQTDEPLTLQQVWTAFQHIYLAPPIPDSPPPPLQLDNPFLVHYAAYHHYRSLGWVVKNGIKFCVDYLLYKRGPVFTHAEFAVVVCPVYEDPADQETSTVDLQNATPFGWSWLSTINRVNSQVMKTLILSYVTIPARSRVSSDVLNSPACFSNYSVREVVVRRFIPARMRD